MGLRPLHARALLTHLVPTPVLCAEVRLVRVTFYSLAATRPGGRADGRAHHALPRSHGCPGKRGLAGGSGDSVLAWSPIRQCATASPPAAARPPSQCVAALSPAPRASLFQPARLLHGCWWLRGPVIGGCRAPEPRVPRPPYSGLPSGLTKRLGAGKLLGLRRAPRPAARPAAGAGGDAPATQSLPLAQRLQTLLRGAARLPKKAC